MMLHKPLAIFSYLCIFMAMSSTAQSDGPPVLDTEGRPLQRDVEYFVKPAITDVAGNLTLVTRKGDQCPFHVGQVPLLSQDIGVLNLHNVTAWRVGETEPNTGRRFVETGSDDTATGYFKIDKDNNFGVYNIGWCPSDVPFKGRPRCGRAGILIEKGLRLLALDGAAFPFEFVRA